MTKAELKTLIVSKKAEYEAVASEIEDLNNDLNSLESEIVTLELAFESSNEMWEDPARSFRHGQIEAAKTLGYKTDPRYVYQEKCRL